MRELLARDIRTAHYFSELAFVACEDEAAPSARAVAIKRGRSSGSSRLISLCETTAWTTPVKSKTKD